MRILGVLLVVAALAVGDEKDFRREFKAGLALYENGDIHKAFDHFDNACRLKPMDWRGHFYRSICLATLGSRELDPTVRQNLFEQAEHARQTVIKTTHNRFRDPIGLYLGGLIDTMNGRRIPAYEKLGKAMRLPRLAYEPYKDFKLTKHVAEAFGIAAMKMAESYIFMGDFDQADKMLREADTNVPADHKDRADLEQNLAVVDEAQGRFESAVKHLRTCQKLRPERKEEFAAVIATIYLHIEQPAKAKKVMDEIPAGSKNPDVLAMRARYLYDLAMNEPEEPIMDKAIAHYREVLEDYPAALAYGLVIELGELMEEKIRPADAAKHKAFIQEQIARLKRELANRPECPKTYWQLHKFYRLLKETTLQARYEMLHARKKKEFEGRARFDRFGRPRCR